MLPSTPDLVAAAQALTQELLSPAKRNEAPSAHTVESAAAAADDGFPERSPFKQALQAATDLLPVLNSATKVIMTAVEVTATCHSHSRSQLRLTSSSRSPC